MQSINIDASNALRYFALVLDSETKDNLKNTIFRDTDAEVKKAETEYDEWYESLPDDHDLRFKCYWAVWGLVQAYEQKALEQGMKAGIGLMINVTGGTVPNTIGEKQSDKKEEVPC